MAWLLFILFLFFAWRAAAYFGQGRPQPAILSLGACALFLAGIFANYMMFQRDRAEPEPAPAAPVLAEAPAPPPSPTPVVIESQPASDLEGFYSDTSDQGEADEPLPDEPMID